jgi:hypothetical protein
MDMEQDTTIGILDRLRGAIGELEIADSAGYNQIAFERLVDNAALVVDLFRLLDSMLSEGVPLPTKTATFPKTAAEYHQLALENIDRAETKDERGYYLVPYPMRMQYIDLAQVYLQMAAAAKDA